MPSSTSDRISRALLEFARDQWAQLGVFMETARRDQWAQDPEALLLFTLEVGREDARLFDEVLDWLRQNGDLVSARRLAHLSQGDPVRPLLEAAVEWAGRHGARLRLGSAGAPTQAEPVSVFRRPGLPGRADETFLRHGFVKPVTVPSQKSSEPDLSLPINFAFRLRRHFGVNARAEIVRFLLTSAVDSATTLAVSEAAASTKRNVSGALTELVAAGDIERYWVGNEARYRIDAERWAAFLALDVIPTYRDWPHLLRGLAEIRRWLARPDLEELSDYLRASEARRLMDVVGPMLQRAGVVVAKGGEGADYWPSFVETVESALAALDAVVPAGERGHR
ncbi:MAG: hypothetical protein WD249_03680 [Gaiellaceae bacterium]